MRWASTTPGNLRVRCSLHLRTTRYHDLIGTDTRGILTRVSQNPLRLGLESSEHAEPFALVIFGVTGDLTRKKLMPALFSLFLRGQIDTFAVIGFARRPWSDDEFREKARAMIASVPDGNDEQRQAFLARLTYVQSTFDDADGYRRLARALAEHRNRLYYLSVPPRWFELVVENLGAAELNAEEHGYARLIIEKPFGHDLASARELSRTLGRTFGESQTYRIDHYLGKETVQNLMLLRFGNGIFEPIWNSRYVDHVQITVAEQEGVGTRADYYEASGALRDVLQNHVLQLLAITAMEPPADLSPNSIRGEKLKIITALDPVTHQEPESHSVRAQYTAGVVDGQEVVGYRAESGVNPDSMTETYVALRCYINTWRWAGVPFLLRTGKRLSRKATEISIHFKAPPLPIFGRSNSPAEHNMLAVRIQPDEGVGLQINAKIPGYETAVRPVNMDFSYGSAFGQAVPEAYERLLFDAMKGDATLYTRGDEVEAAWEFVTPVLTAWQLNEAPMTEYPAGSAGPGDARMLLGSPSRRWRKL